MTVEQLEGVAREHAQILRNYTEGQCEAALQIYELARRHIGTSGGNTAAKLLLGIYNGYRFPFDLTDLRYLDAGNLSAALEVLRADATRTYCEIHELLDAIRGPWSDVGSELECWAYELRLKKRCTKDGYAEMCLRVANSQVSTW